MRNAMWQRVNNVAERASSPLTVEECRKRVRSAFRAAPACLEVILRQDSLSRNLSSEKKDYPSSVLSFTDVVVSQSVTG